MDLLQSVRKEGSRGGVNFSWDEVKNSNHRENYLGHSLMAPVGRWQKNKDLSWYAKADDADLTPEQRAERAAAEKREELRKVKQAEEDAMARALGLPVPDRTNANEEPLGMDRATQKQVNDALKEALTEEGVKEEDERGVGFGEFDGGNGGSGKDVLKGSRPKDDGLLSEDGGRDRDREIGTGSVDTGTETGHGLESGGADHTAEKEITRRTATGDGEIMMLDPEAGVEKERSEGDGVEADHAHPTADDEVTVIDEIE